MSLGSVEKEINTFKCSGDSICLSEKKPVAEVLQVNDCNAAQHVTPTASGKHQVSICYQQRQEAPAYTPEPDSNDPLARALLRR